MNRYDHRRPNWFVGVSVTAWMTAPGTPVSQRLCFYTLVDTDPNGIGNCVCMETQKFWYENETIRIECSIVPDNPNVGNVFRIQSYWKISPVSDRQCFLSISGEVECKKSLLGMQGMVENILSQKIKASYQKWFAFSVPYIEKAKQEIELENERKRKQASLAYQNQTKSKLHRRWHALQTRVMAGTENIVKLLKDGASLSTISQSFVPTTTSTTSTTVLSTSSSVLVDSVGDVSSKNDVVIDLGGAKGGKDKDKESDEEIIKKTEDSGKVHDRGILDNVTNTLRSSYSYIVFLVFLLVVCIYAVYLVL